jgi:WhiB family redox-sensing transcriptional regulator
MYTSVTNPNSIPFTSQNSSGTTSILDKEIAMHTLLAPTAPTPDLALVEPKEPDSPPGLEVDQPRTDDQPRKAPVARCADGHGTMVGLFFSDNIIDIARAKAMCGLCPLQVSCLAGALEREEPWGVWGGELLSGGRIIANKRACGRPPTRPRPEVIIDEMGPVGVPA